MCVALDVEVPGPSGTTDANLHFALVFNALVFVAPEIRQPEPPLTPTYKPLCASASQH